MLKKFLGLAFAASLLAGCAVGQKIDYSQQYSNIPTVKHGTTVSLGVQDLRPYVLAGEKDSSFVGVQRGGFYNPFDVNTSSGRPLADDLLQAFTNTLKSAGTIVTGSTLSSSLSPDMAVKTLSKNGSERILYISYREWKSDSFSNSWIVYDITAQIFDKNMKKLGENHLQGKDAITSSAAMAANDANNSITSAFQLKIKELLSNQEIIVALQ
tara:strand:+ start:101285 stop:101920 length:636 start_codon:yes stop_codon:yes gene_type:complete